LPLCILW